MKRHVRLILELLMWICVNGRNEDTSAVEIDMTVVTLPSRKLKYWQKMRLEGTIEKWPEAQRVVTPHINTGSAVEAAASLSVSHSESCFVQGANIAMKMNGAIAGDSTTGQKKFTARQWAALIGFCGVATRKQVPKVWNQIEKDRCGHRNKGTTS